MRSPQKLHLRSKGRDKQAMMLKGPEHTEKRGELRAKASQNYDRAVKKRKAGYVKNTASPQGPVRKMTAESISDIVAVQCSVQRCVQTRKKRTRRSKTSQKRIRLTGPLFLTKITLWSFRNKYRHF